MEVETLASTCVLKGLKDFCTSAFNSLGVGGLSLTCVKGIKDQHINKVKRCGVGPGPEMNLNLQLI